MCFFLWVNPKAGRGGLLLCELSSSDESSELSSFCFFLNFSGRMFNFFIEVLQASFHHSSFQLVGPPRVFLPSPVFSSLRLIWTQSVLPCWFLPSPLPSFQPIFCISFLAYSLSKRMLETPELWSSRSRYLLAIQQSIYLLYGAQAIRLLSWSQWIELRRWEGTVTISEFVGQNLKRGQLYKIMLGREPKRKTYLTDTFQSEENDRSASNFMMDRTLYKGIKENDVSKIIDISNEGGNLGENALPSEEQELENIVVEMRKRYDEVKTNTKNLTTELEKSKKAVDMLKDQENKLQEHIQNTKTDYESIKTNCQNLSNTVESLVYDLDIYKELEHRLKKDILVMKKRNFDQDSRLKKENIKLKTLRQDDFNKTKLSYKCRDMLQSIERAVTTKQNERTTKINSFYDALNRRHQNLIKREERQKQIEEVMMKAMSQKLQEEKEWMNICAANIFLKKFLKNKMQILIRQNHEIQTAYHKIRSNTDIKDCKDLITRFLNRERDYGVLLESISQKEHKLQGLKQEKEGLEKIDQDLTQEADEIQESVGRKGAQFGPLKKEIEGVESTLKNIEEKEELMSKWAFKLLCAFHNKSKEYFQKKFVEKSVKELLVQALNEIVKYTDSVLGEQNCSDKINNAFMSTRPSAKIFEDEMLSRNKRVKTTAVDDSNVEDERDAFYDGNSEAEFLHYNRRVTKKNDYNRRFRIKTQLK